MAKQMYKHPISGREMTVENYIKLICKMNDDKADEIEDQKQKQASCMRENEALHRQLEQAEKRNKENIEEYEAKCKEYNELAEEYKALAKHFNELVAPVNVLTGPKRILTLLEGITRAETVFILKQVNANVTKKMQDRVDALTTDLGYTSECLKDMKEASKEVSEGKVYFAR